MADREPTPTAHRRAAHAERQARTAVQLLRKSHRQAAFIVVGVLVLFVAVLVPFALTSVVANIASPQSHQVMQLAPSGTPSATSVTYANLDIVSVDEWAGVATIRVTGQQHCEATCASTTVLTFLSVPPAFAAGQGKPPAQDVAFQDERDGPVNQTIQLPVYGDPVRYPFDAYQFVLVVLVRQRGPNGSSSAPLQGLNQPDGQALFASLRMLAPRMQITTPRPASVHELGPLGAAASSLVSVTVTYGRPLYIKILTVLLVLLVTAAAAYAVFLRPLQDLVLNAGALVLGIWGVRAILLGATVPGITAVDLALSVVILFLLVALTVRALLYLRRRITDHGQA